MTPKPNIPLASYWLNAAESEYATPEDWQRWADRIILAMPKPPPWVLELCIAKGLEDVSKAVGDQLYREDATEARHMAALTGYTWLRYRRGDFGLHECMTLSSRIMHPWEDQIFDVLDKLEAGASEAAAAAEFESVIRPLIDVAEQQWAELWRTQTL
jgi:hypothetical protein